MELLQLIEEFRKKRNWDKNDSPSILAKSIVIEASELLEHFQWDDNQFDKQQVCDELADVLMYCYAMCIQLKVDPQAIIEHKLIDVAKRYPVVND